MSSLLKSGWHPKGKEGGKESWRGDFKGVNQVAGWMGKGKKPGEGREESTHVARPLATLKDPTLFGPPPKNVNYHGGAALPNEITPHTSGLGAPLTQEEINDARHIRNQPDEDTETPERAPPPPLPYRADRTGLKTENLPTPPVRRNLMSSTNDTQVPAPARSTPSLPPRLPSRQNTSPSPANTVTSPPPAYETAVPTASTPNMNQLAMSRLGNAGVSVPAFGIGKSKTPTNESNPWRNEQSQSTNSSQVSELQSQFKRMTSASSTPAQTTSAVSPPQSETKPQPPSWQQTQSTFRTAQNLHQNPNNVTLADAQQAANTAQSAHTSAKAFRERHSDKFDAAERKATTLNKRYNVTGRLNKFLEDANDEHDKTQQQATPQAQANANTQTQVQSETVPQNYQTVQSPSAPSTPQPVSSPQPVSNTTPSQKPAHIARKPPPPPPPKKPASMQTGNQAAPPPVPLGTRPSFGQ